MLLNLPTSLLALLFASPVLSGPTTPNDLFHDIALHTPKQPEEPVCCLRPLSPLEAPAEDDLLLSFEEWKAKRLSDATEKEPAPAQSATHGRPGAENASQAAVPDATPPHTDVQGAAPSEAQDTASTQESVPSHLQIPIHDRFNYASLDCSARVHAAHKTAKSPSSILSHKKDRYMLSPCAESSQFVIVELCEDIRIDTVQLANYEFFSGVFKDFTVSVSKKYYPNDPESWTFAGTYRAKNVRGVQSFHPPPTLRGFYRFIRIDFHSHYGSEYYCPLSLLRVYGLTHLEEWQWETWDAESRAKRSVEEASSPIEVIAEPPKPIPVPAVEPEEKAGSPSVVPNDIPPSPGFSTESVATVTSDTLVATLPGPSPSSHTVEKIPKTSEPHVGSQHQTHTETLSPTPKTSACADSMPDDHSRSTDPLYNTQAATAPSSPSVHHPSSLTSSSSLRIHSQNLSTASANHSTVFINPHSDSGSHSASSHSSSSVRSAAASPDVSSLAVISPSYSSYSHPAPPAPPASSGGESIYRLIMNRLTALEANTTLYARYVEEQTAGMREVLRRLSEDIGRLESIGKTQAQLYQRSVVELEKHTRRLESEHQQLVSHVNHLADEVVLEKRLGIAQLCLLLTVLVFMALTRGSRGEVVYQKRGSTVREWGRRTLSISGDWVNRLRTRSSTPPRQPGQKPGENEIAFPSLDMQAVEHLSRSTRRAPSLTNGARRHAPRPHTPTTHRTPTSRHAHAVHHRAVPASPSFLRPAMQRSSSGSMTLGFGGVGPVPRSAKRWARSAHLHEVKGAMFPPSSPDPGPGPSVRRRKSGEATPLASGSRVDEAGGGDLFSPHAHGQVLTIPFLDGAGTISKGKARAVGLQGPRQPSPLRASPVIDLASPPSRPARGRRASRAESELSEGDAWVDTDMDGSECDLGAGAGADGLARERTYVGAAANSSL